MSLKRRARPPVVYATAPKLWPGETCVIVASGPSLTKADVELARGRARTIVINTSYLMAPWADVLYACDSRWWRWNPSALGFAGLKFTLGNHEAFPGVQILRKGRRYGLATDPAILNLGGNSGFQAVNLAVHFGVARILLLGFDMQRGPNRQMHWHKDHPIQTPNLFCEFLRAFSTLEDPLVAAGVEVVNCSRATAMRCFPRQTIEEALGVAKEVAA